MGNCQATKDAEAIVIYHPGISCNGSYKMYRASSISAEEIMFLYPGYYVSLVDTVSTKEGIRLKQIKLLRPQDTLSIGRVYRLISFGDVSLELSSRTRGKLVVRGGGDEVDEEGRGGRHRKKGPSRRAQPPETRTSNCCSYEAVEGTAQIDGSDTATTSSSTATTSSSSRMHSRHWRPSLKSISEFVV